jgi:hypothetical protein
MTSPVADTETAFYTKLNVSAITTLATSGVHNKLAPAGTPLPYVIFQQQGGGDENATPTRSRMPLYVVKAIASSQSAATAIDSAIDALLNNGSLLSISGWTTYWLMREQDVNYIEVTAQGVPIYHIGGIYRLRFSK